MKSNSPSCGQSSNQFNPRGNNSSSPFGSVSSAVRGGNCNARDQQSACGNTSAQTVQSTIKISVTELLKLAA
ncbi:MAG TPA: hypothetical protein VGG24_07360 [Paraburkholderia sp.]